MSRPQSHPADIQRTHVRVSSYSMKERMREETAKARRPELFSVPSRDADDEPLTQVVATPEELLVARRGRQIQSRNSGVVCADQIERGAGGQSGLERTANTYASNLLMPEYVFDPTAWRHPRLTFEVVRTIADLFDTSIKATAIRLVGAREPGRLRQSALLVNQIAPVESEQDLPDAISGPPDRDR